MLIMSLTLPPISETERAFFAHESHIVFQQAFARLFGDPPARSRSDKRVVISWVASPLGPLVAGASARGICLLEFSDRRRLPAQVTTLQRRFECPLVPGRHEEIDHLNDQLAQYFAGTLTEFAVPLDDPGTSFQRDVWDALRRIPYGETRSYDDLARELAGPGASRAVGHANGLNRVAIVIPCHRVINKNGKLGGYGGGLWRKQYLLDLERGNRQLPV
ncbi:MAG: methylated-DNA--[protein]-cysteine S-methyltransferase [Luteitalea sp.]|nr:methylated-DNA--[protein]-cysteine S-methyltransferase [Luteitalea sp.]